MNFRQSAGTLSPIAIAIYAVFASTLATPGHATEPEKEPVKLDTVIVSGDKSKRSQQDTSSSVAVTTAQRIEQENLSTLAEVIDRTANLSSTYGSGYFSIRGMQNEPGQPNPLSTVYLDGAALPSEATNALPTDLWDIAQVEVFRGPQSTIQGQNALAGAIVLRTQDPTMQWDARARLVLSDPKDRSVAFAGGGPIIKDELAFRVALEDRAFEGFTYNPTRSVGDDKLDSTLGRFKLLWKPKAIDGLTTRLSISRDKRNGPYQFSYSRIDVPDYFKNRVNFSNEPNSTEGHVDVATLELNYRLDSAWALNAIVSNTQSDLTRRYDMDFSAAALEYGQQHELSSGRSQELRLHYEGERLRGLVGIYASKRERDSITRSRSSIETPVPTISGVLQGAGFPAADAEMIAGMYAQTLPRVLVNYKSVAPSSSENRALFSDAEYRLATDWTALAGFRYDRETYAFRSETAAAFAGTLPSPAVFDPSQGLIYAAVAGINDAVLGMVSQAGSATPATESHFDAFLPKAGVRWNWSPEHSLALTAQRGYRSGGSSFNMARAQVIPFEPETTNNYELAMRTRWQDGRLSLNANAYYIDWKDKQVTAYFDSNAFDFHTVNAGRAHLYGFELEARQRLSHDLDWYASVGHSRTRYDSFELPQNGQTQDYSGQEFAYAPQWTAALGINFLWGQGWTANVNTNFRSSMQSEVGADARDISKRSLVNAKIGYESERWNAYVFASNLFDRGYVQYYMRDHGILGAPRVVGVGMNWFL